MEGQFDMEETQLCENCKKYVSKANFSLHSVHCQRNISLCNLCNESYPKNEIDNHMTDAHAYVTCEKCGVEVERQKFEMHKNEKCPNRLVKCRICDLDIADCDLNDHIDYCGSRTEKCEVCGRYVMLKFIDIHLSSNHSFLSMEDVNNLDAPNVKNLDLVQENTNKGESLFNISDEDYAHGHAFDDLLPDAYPTSRNALTDDFSRLLHLGSENRSTSFFTPQTFGSPYMFSSESNRRTAEVPLTGDKVPCEFCGELFDTNMLLRHQDVCDVRTDEQPAYPPLFPNIKDEIYSASANTTLIPCEYCHKQFDADFIIEHQRGCDSFHSVTTSENNGPILDDDTEYINDLLLKEAIQNSLSDNLLKNNHIASPPKLMDKSTSSLNSHTPKVRNIPIKLESTAASQKKLETKDTATSALVNGKQRPIPSLRRYAETEDMFKEDAATGTRPKNSTQDHSRSPTIPKPPARRRNYKDFDKQ